MKPAELADEIAALSREIDRLNAILSALRRVEKLEAALREIAAEHDGGCYTDYDGGYIDGLDYAAEIARQALTGEA